MKDTYSKELAEFNRIFSRDYEEIIAQTKTMIKTYDDDIAADIVHKCYEKLHKAITKRGFKGENYRGFIYLSVRNEHLMTCNYNNRWRMVYYQGESDTEKDLLHQVDHILCEKEIDALDTLEYQENLMEITKELFKFIEQRFPEQDLFLFTEYYLGENKRTTYKELADKIGMSDSTVSNKMKAMKKSIRKDFITFLKEN